MPATFGRDEEEEDEQRAERYFLEVGVHSLDVTIEDRDVYRIEPRDGAGDCVACESRVCGPDCPLERARRGEDPHAGGGREVHVLVVYSNDDFWVVADGRIASIFYGDEFRDKDALSQRRLAGLYEAVGLRPKIRVLDLTERLDRMVFGPDGELLGLSLRERGPGEPSAVGGGRAVGAGGRPCGGRRGGGLMGWVFQHRRTGTSNQDWFQQHFGEGHQILDMATVKGTVYGAVKLPDGRVEAVVILTRWVRGDQHNFGYKDMDESMGPCEDECPARILDRLSDPAPNDYAVEWRAKCRARLEQRAARPVVRRGDTVWFLKPLKFESGDELDTFVFEQRNSFRASYGRYRISGWRGMDYEVVCRA